MTSSGNRNTYRSVYGCLKKGASNPEVSFISIPTDSDSEHLRPLVAPMAATTMSEVATTLPKTEETINDKEDDQGSTELGDIYIELEEMPVKTEIIEISDESGDDTKKKKRRKRTPKEPKWKFCSECGKSFKTNPELTKHLRTHTGERPFMCTECGKTYTQPGHLQTHMLMHQGVRNFQCDECSAKFYRNNDLERHMKVHTGEKPFQCEICTKAFTQKNNLMMHVKMHLGDRPHECPYCNKRFITKSKLRQHVKKHDKDKKKNPLFYEDEEILST